MMPVRLLCCLVLVVPACAGLAGCQRPITDRLSSAATPAQVVEVVRDASGDPKDAGQEVNGLALGLAADQDALLAGQSARFTLTLHNRSDKTFQVALHDDGCCLWSNLQFTPELELGRGGHTVEPNFFPGGVHLVFRQGKIALKFRLDRTADGKSLVLPTKAHGGAGCGGPLLLPADARKLDIRFRLYDSAEANWSNLKFTEPRWSGECLSNPVTLKLE